MFVVSNYLQLSFQNFPVAIETFGPWAPMGIKLIKEVGRKICDLTGEKRSMSYLLQSISIAIQSGNAASVM